MEDIIREIKKYFDLNWSDNIACKNLWAEGEPLWVKMLRKKKQAKTSTQHHKKPLPQDNLTLKLVMQRK